MEGCGVAATSRQKQSKASNVQDTGTSYHSGPLSTSLQLETSACVPAVLGALNLEMFFIF